MSYFIFTNRTLCATVRDNTIRSLKLKGLIIGFHMANQHLSSLLGIYCYVQKEIVLKMVLEEASFVM